MWILHYKYTQSLAPHCWHHPLWSESLLLSLCLNSAARCKSSERCAHLITWCHRRPHLDKPCVSFGSAPTASCKTNDGTPAAPPQESRFIYDVGREGRGHGGKMNNNVSRKPSPGRLGSSKNQLRKGDSRCGFRQRMVNCGSFFFSPCFSFLFSVHLHVTKGFNFWAQLLPILPACSSVAAAGKF